MWPLAAAATVITAAAWIRLASPVWLWGCGLAVLVAIPARPRHAHGGREILFLALAVLFVGEGIRARFERVERESDWASWSRATASAATETFARDIEATATELRETVRAAVAGDTGDAAVWDVLERHVRGHPDRAVLRARDGRPEAWAGRLAVPVDSLPATHGVMVTPFYLALYVVERRGNVTAVATALLHAEPPANNLTSPLDVAAARAAGVAGYIFAPATVTGDSVRRVMVDGDAVLAVRSVVAPPGVVALMAAERARLRSGALPRALRCTLPWRSPGRR